MQAVIISSGSIDNYVDAKKMCSGRYVICADGGLSHCMAMGIVPDVWIGDKDSCLLSNKEFEAATQNCKIIKLNPEKDATDTELACEYAADNAFDDIVLLGATGTRFDHTIANVYLLKKMADSGVKAKIADSNNIIYVADRHNIIKKGDFDYVSVIPLDICISGITNNGLYYKLDNERLEKYSSRGISNKLTENVATIDITDGDALIILSKD